MYLPKPGAENTAATLTIALTAARVEQAAALVVASCSGQTVEQLLELPETRELMAGGMGLVCVTHANGFREPGMQEMAPETRTRLEAAGVQVVTATHVLSGAERSLSRKFGGVNPVELIAAALRMMGQGTKVCVECAVMALDAGCIPYMTPIVAVGGSSKGADTALVLRTAHAANLLDTKIDKVLCKPVL